MKSPIPLEQLKAILETDGFITSADFDKLVQEADRKNQNILDVLVAERVVERDYLDNLVAKLLGVPRITLAAAKIDKQVLQLLPEATARERQTILFRREDDGTYDAAMTDPSDLETVEFFNQLLAGRDPT